MSEKSIQQLFDLSGKVAIVTGAAMGIGKAIADRLSEAGASVMITDINIEAAQKTVKELKAMGRKAEAFQADASQVASAGQAVKATLDAFGGLDILVNNREFFRFHRCYRPPRLFGTKCSTSTSKDYSSSPRRPPR